MKLSKSLFVFLMVATAYSTNVVYQHDFTNFIQRTIASTEISKENVLENIKKFEAKIVEFKASDKELVEKFKVLKEDKKLKDVKEFRDEKSKPFGNSLQDLSMQYSDIKVFLDAGADDVELTEAKEKFAAALANYEMGKSEFAGSEVDELIAELIEEKVIASEARLEEINETLCESKKKLDSIDESLKGITELKDQMTTLFAPTYSPFDYMMGSGSGAFNMGLPSFLQPQRSSADMTPYLMMALMGQSNNSRPSYMNYSPINFAGDITDSNIGSMFDRSFESISDRYDTRRREGPSFQNMDFLDKGWMKTNGFTNIVPRFSRDTDAGSVGYDFNNLDKS